MMETGSKFLGRTCAECLKWMWDKDGVMGRDRKKYASVNQCVQITGKVPWERANGIRPPCFECPKIPDDAPTDEKGQKTYYSAIEITERTYQTIQYNDECKEVNDYPKDPKTGEVDPIVKKNAAIISNIRRVCQQADSMKMLAQLVPLSGLT